MILVDVSGLLSIHLRNKNGAPTQTHWENKRIYISVSPVFNDITVIRRKVPGIQQTRSNTALISHIYPV